MKKYTDKEKAAFVYGKLMELFPEAGCELNYKTDFQMLVATVLSARTTDKAVNKVTPKLFERYPESKAMANAKEEDVLKLIKTVGLAPGKARRLIELSRILTEKHDGKVPSRFEDLIALPGVGRKTANVVLSEVFGIPRIAVDTHVAVSARRIGLSLATTPLKIEEDLMSLFPKNNWIKLHHLLIFFGRYRCKALHPLCEDCPFMCICMEHKNQK